MERVIKKGDHVKIANNDEMRRQYQEGNEEFRRTLRTVMPFVGVVGGISNEGVATVNYRIKVRGEALSFTYFFDVGILNSYDPSKEDSLFKESSILVSENKDYDFKGIFIIEDPQISKSGDIYHYRIMLSSLGGVEHMFKNNKISGIESSVREATKEEIEHLKNYIMNKAPRDIKWEDYAKYFKDEGKEE